jgi:hypothetical protein
MRPPCCLCVPANVAKQRLRKHSRGNEYTGNKRRTVWTRCSVCGPCIKNSVCSETNVRTFFAFFLSKSSPCLRLTTTRRTSGNFMGTFETGGKDVFSPTSSHFFSSLSLSLSLSRKVDYSFFSDLVTFSICCASTLFSIYGCRALCWTLVAF